MIVGKHKLVFTLGNMVFEGEVVTFRIATAACIVALPLGVGAVELLGSEVTESEIHRVATAVTRLDPSLLKRTDKQ